MAEALDIVVATRQGAHAAATGLYTVAKHLIADGKRVRIRAEEAQDDRSVQQNRFYWGVVLAEVSEQAAINGQRWTAEAWHELFKRQFLGYSIRKVAVAGRKRKTVIRALRSTTDLKVRPMSEYLERVIAFAATELSVEFSLRDWVFYTDAVRREREARR